MPSKCFITIYEKYTAKSVWEEQGERGGICALKRIQTFCAECHANHSGNVKSTEQRCPRMEFFHII